MYMYLIFKGDLRIRVAFSLMYHESADIFSCYVKMDNSVSEP